jgi:hypothetical protein
MKSIIKMRVNLALVVFFIMILILTGFALGEEIIRTPANAIPKSIENRNRQSNSFNHQGDRVFGTIKFEETFDDTIPPAGWQTVNNDISSPPHETWRYYEAIHYTTGDSVLPQAGKIFWANNFRNANGFIIDDWLISPRLPELKAEDSLYVYVNATGLTFPDTLTIWVSVTDSSILNFNTLIGTIVDPGPVGEWHLYSLDITDSGALVGLEPFVGFRHDHQNGGQNGPASNWVHLDHVILADSLPPVGIADKDVLSPEGFLLKQNYPNPFNPATTIVYELGKSAEVSLKIYSLTGREVKTLVNEKQSAGSRQAVWDGRDNSGYRVASGVYLYRLQVGNAVQTKKMVLLK